MASLKQINEAIQNLNCEGDKPSLDNAINALNDVLNALDGLTVKGRDAVDVLAGCYICIEQIIGEEDTNG
jgi:hypothetical protein